MPIAVVLSKSLSGMSIDCSLYLDARLFQDRLNIDNLDHLGKCIICTGESLKDFLQSRYQ